MERYSFTEKFANLIFHLFDEIEKTKEPETKERLIMSILEIYKTVFK